MTDVINQIDNENTGESELWITIKDASDLLSVSERHAWNIITAKGLKTKKLLNQHRKKTYVLRADIEQYHKDEQERERLDALKGSPLSAKSALSEKEGVFEMSESGVSPLSEGGLVPSDRTKSLPALIREMQTKQETLQKGVVKWRVTSLWVAVLGLVIAVGLGLYLNEVKTALSESQKAISERETRLSESQKALSELSERAFMLSEREKDALKTVFEREDYIKRLEDTLPKDKLDELKKEQGR